MMRNQYHPKIGQKFHATAMAPPILIDCRGYCRQASEGYAQFFHYGCLIALINLIAFKGALILVHVREA